MNEIPLTETSPAESEFLRPDLARELVEQWKDAAEAGLDLSPEELCANCPDLMSLVRDRIAALRTIHAERTHDLALDTQAAHEQSDTTLAPGVIPRVEHPFRDLKYLARGGLGTVFTARDEHLHREVVIKFIRHRIAGDPESIDRFRMEGEITSRLDHPGIVPVYGMGQLPDGRVFYVMRYIRGESLKEAIARFHDGETGLSRSERAVTFHKLLTSFVVACQTVAYAHKRGIINRDLKPEHIVMGRYGETLVMDWGLAMPVGRSGQFRDESEKTLMVEAAKGSGSSDSGAGTLMYMSPEQAALDDRLTPATDIYSLGATLYVLLTGKQPFVAGTCHEIRQKVIRGECLPPQEANPRAPKALAAICQKAMSLNPQDRYATALDLAADIERYLADEPVSVLPDTRSAAVVRWARRHRGTALTGLVSLVTLMLLAVVSALALLRSSHQTNLAYQASLAANAEANDARQDSLHTAATYAAKMLGQEVQNRWLALELAAGDPELNDLLAQRERSALDPSEANQVHDALDAWLKTQHVRHFPSARSWALYDLEARQIGRSPPAPELRTQQFAYRSYFHGGESDLPESTTWQDVRPLESPHVSTAFRAKSDGQLVVTFAIPLRQAQRVRGVLMMTVPVGEFDTLALGAADSHQTLLIDLRRDWQQRRGLVLFHPDAASRTVGPSSYLDAATLQQLCTADKSSASNTVLAGFRDPVHPGETPQAAFDRVHLQTPYGATFRGWAVIVREKR